MTSRLNLKPSLGVPRSLLEQPKDDCPSLSLPNNLLVAFHIELQTDKTLLAVHLNQAKRAKKLWKVDRYFKGCVRYGNFLFFPLSNCLVVLYVSLDVRSANQFLRWEENLLTGSVSHYNHEEHFEMAWRTHIISAILFLGVRWHWPNNPHCSFQKWTLTRSPVLLSGYDHKAQKESANFSGKNNYFQKGQYTVGSLLNLS